MPHLSPLYRFLTVLSVVFGFGWIFLPFCGFGWFFSSVLRFLPIESNTSVVNFGVLIKLHILISLLFIWEFRTEDRGGCGRQRKQTYKERRRKRNKNKLNRVWTIIICAVLHGATSMNNSPTLVLRFKNNIRSAYTPAIPEDTKTWIYCQSMVIDEVRDHLSVIICKNVRSSNTTAFVWWLYIMHDLLLMM